MKAAIAAVTVVVAVLAPVVPAAAATAPVGVPDQFETPDGTVYALGLPYGILANDIPAVPGDTLTATLVEGPDHGSLSLNEDGGFGYTADFGYEGTDGFTYVAVGPDGATSEPTAVTIEVGFEDADPREPTVVELGNGGLALDALPNGSSAVGLVWNLVARATDLSGDRVGAGITFVDRHGATLCEGSYGVWGLQPWARCSIPLTVALRVTLDGGEVTARYAGGLLHRPSSATGQILAKPGGILFPLR